jgi:hypothetical protein
MAKLQNQMPPVGAAKLDSLNLGIPPGPVKSDGLAQRFDGPAAGHRRAQGQRKESLDMVGEAINAQRVISRAFVRGASSC